MKSTAYELMRMSEDSDEDAYDAEDIREEKEKSAQTFKEKYKEFYSDIKISIKEDW